MSLRVIYPAIGSVQMKTPQEYMQINDTRRTALERTQMRNNHANLSCDTLHLSNSGCEPGGRLNKKDGLTRYGDSHVKDKTS